MIYDSCWLPGFVDMGDFPDWASYEDELYRIFRETVVEGSPEFGGLPVRIRRHPMEYGREEAFWHVTCQDYAKDGQRLPDIRRCERVRWVRAFIDNCECARPECLECAGMMMWSAAFGSKRRVKILLEEERYVVILEPRGEYVLLITAYYVDHDHSLRKLVKEYEREKQRRAPERTPSDTPSTHGR